MLVDSGPRSRSRERGVTFIELMVTFSVAAILVSIGLPSMSRFVAGQRVKTASYDLQAAFMAARSEAVKRGGNVTITSTGGNWASGWTIASGSVTLANQAALSSLSVTASSSAITFQYSGRISDSSNQTFQITSSNTSGGYDATRCIGINTSGQPTTKLGTCS